jgi:superfamily II DNA or RNA helicase
MSFAFKAAYEAAEAFSRLYAQRCPGAGFLRTILLRRIGSSALAGLETARRLLDRIDETILSEDEISDEGEPRETTPPDPQEILYLREVERNLAAVVDGTEVDPKVQVILHFLRERRWLEDNGAIIFSQYRTTAEWVLEALCNAFPDVPVGLYARGAASFVALGGERTTATREQIKRRIQNGEIRLVCATDAACEGLNLQRLGAQINVDMPWNPSRLEQRKGRVQRIGQIRDNVHVLNLRYAGTVEDDVYAALSNRFGDIFSVLAQLPDAFEDDWIAAILKDRSAVLNFSQRVQTAKPAMELRYNQDMDDHGLDWEYTERVLSSRDLDEWMRQGW